MTDATQVDWMSADKVFIKQIHITGQYALIPQHSHKYDHSTVVAVGGVRVWEDGVPKGDHVAPALLFIKAGVKHTFQTLTPETLLLCLHNGMREDVAAVLEEHQIEL